MRITLLALLGLMTTAAVGQALDGGEPSEPAPAAAGGSKEAQLAEIEALEPAADLGESRPPGSEQARGGVIQRYATMDELDLGTTSITGNQELPKVLYIVPWKKSDLGDLVGRPVNTLLDEVLAPVDPEVFERHLDYYDALYGTGEQE